MKIVGWTWAEDPQYKEMFPPGEGTFEEFDAAREIVIKELRDKGYKFTGYYHQGGDFGVPVFDTGEKLVCSYRTWGGIMADAYPEEVDNSDGFGYTEWAWITDREMILPSEDDY